MLLNKSTAPLFESPQQRSYRPLMTTRRRVLTEEEQSDAMRLRALWGKKKQKGVTQETIYCQTSLGSTSCTSR